MNIKNFLRHKGFVIQWHITEQCNWKCSHCYQRAHPAGDLPLAGLETIAGKCLELFNTLRISPRHARINIGGGEPFLRNDFFKLLRTLNSKKNRFSVQIMTNGSLITKETAGALKKTAIVKGVQVSLEGLEKNNDAIRGKGSFKKVIRAIEILKENKIYTRVSLTLTRQNLPDIAELLLLLKEAGVNSVGIRRYVPIGRGAALEKEMLSPGQLNEFYREKSALKQRLDRKGKFLITQGCEDGISFDKDSPSINNCGVVQGHHLNIFANGDILACRRLPIIAGNALKSSLLDIYFSSDILWGLRNMDNAHPLCKKCASFKYCLGGARCITYAYFKNLSMPDPQCWRLFKKLPRKGLCLNSLEKNGKLQDLTI